MSIDKLMFSETFPVLASPASSSASSLSSVSSSSAVAASVDVAFYFYHDEEMTTDDSRDASPLPDAAASPRARRSLDLTDETMTSAVVCFVKNFIG